MEGKRRMKTLDEVMHALEVCTSGYCSNHDGDCPYLGHYKCNEEQRKLDALHYLQEYRMLKDDIVAKRKTLEAEIDRYQEAVKKCEEAENKYRMLNGELEGFPSNMRMNIRW